MLLLMAALALTGCAALGAARLSSSSADTPVLRGGDVLVGLESVDPRRGVESRVVRYRHALGDDGARVEARTLLSADGVPIHVAATADGRWLATTLHRAGAVSTTLWRLREGRADPAWESPPGCRQPSFDPEARFVVLACPPDRQPAWLLTVSLPDLQMLALVGETPRGAPAVGVEGDLYWIERDRARTRVLRRAGDSLPFVTHEIPDEVEALHPREDGVLVATVRTPHGGLELLELHPSGDVTPLPLPLSLGAGTVSRLVSNPQGDLVAVRCPRGDCAVVDAPQGGGEALPPLTVSGTPRSLALVPHGTTLRPRPEDLATAPERVLSTHLSSDVAVLGVGLGMSLEEGFAVLDGSGLDPWWQATPGPRGTPTAIGIGRAAGSWCIEYQADERGIIEAVDMRDCAAPYVSPALEPLLDTRRLVEGAEQIVRRYLGPGVSMAVGEGVGAPGEARHHPVRRTTLQYDAPERGYVYRSETEVLQSRPGKAWDGRVFLRLQEPGKRQVARP